LNNNNDYLEEERSMEFASDVGVVFIRVIEKTTIKDDVKCY
jgi:hypothetical protein